MSATKVLEKYKHRLEMDNLMLNNQSDCPSKLLLKEIDELKIIIEALQFQQEVVRCKDCIHYSNPEIGWCDIHSHMTSTSLDDWTTFDDNSFCSDGERRDEE